MPLGKPQLAKPSAQCLPLARPPLPKANMAKPPPPRQSRGQRPPPSPRARWSPLVPQAAEAERRAFRTVGAPRDSLRRSRPPREALEELVVRRRRWAWALPYRRTPWADSGCRLGLEALWALDWARRSRRWRRRRWELEALEALEEISWQRSMARDLVESEGPVRWLVARRPLRSEVPRTEAAQ